MKKIYFLTAVLLSAGGVFAQGDDEAFIKEAADHACNCSREISVELSKKEILEKINSCVTTGIFTVQMNATMGGLMDKAKETIDASAKVGDTTVISDKNIVIVADKHFDEIQAELRQNCKSVQWLLHSNNEKSDRSMSKNKKALEHYKEGQTYSAEEKHDLAVVSFNKAVKADPKFAFAWDNLGISYRKLGNYKEAIKCYQKSLEIDPTGTMPLQNMAVAYEYLKDYKESAATYMKFIAMYPDNPEGYFGAGRVYYISEDYAKGVDNMFKAYRLYDEAKSPYISDAIQNLKYYYSDLEKKGKLEIFKEAAKNNNISLD